jgi:hypothetical protein
LGGGREREEKNLKFKKCLGTASLEKIATICAYIYTYILKNDVKFFDQS